MGTQANPAPLKVVRIMVYIDPQVRRELKSALALEGTSVSEFFRRAAAERLRRKSNPEGKRSPSGSAARR